MSSLVDKCGNLNIKMIEKELNDNMVKDLEYQQKDAMKKRAVKVAKDYGEFKNMVAASHLKKLNAEEVCRVK
jgi:hypothetical protein